MQKDNRTNTKTNTLMIKSFCNNCNSTDKYTWMIFNYTRKRMWCDRVIVCAVSAHTHKHTHEHLEDALNVVSRLWKIWIGIALHRQNNAFFSLRNDAKQLSRSDFSKSFAKHRFEIDRQRHKSVTVFDHISIHGPFTFIFDLIWNSSSFPLHSSIETISISLVYLSDAKTNQKIIRKWGTVRRWSSVEKKKRKSSNHIVWQSINRSMSNWQNHLKRDCYDRNQKKYISQTSIIKLFHIFFFFRVIYTY